MDVIVIDAATLVVVLRLIYIGGGVVRIDTVVDTAAMVVIAYLIMAAVNGVVVTATAVNIRAAATAANHRVSANRWHYGFRWSWDINFIWTNGCRCWNFAVWSCLWWNFGDRRRTTWC